MENTQKTIAVLSEIAKLENVIADFYDTCSLAYPDTSDMWKTLSEEEREHAGYVTEIITAIEKEPHKFISTCKFTIETVQTVIGGVNDYINQVKNKELSQKEALFIAKDIEYSNLEKNFCNIVSFTDPQYKNLTEKLVRATKTQREFLVGKISQYA